jgi:hypothetical protein
MTLRSLLREPLLHFVVLGLILFGVRALLTRGDGSEADRRIQVTETEVQWLASTWESRWQRPPTEQELRGLVDAYIREEVLYREALDVGLDRDDQVIRRRLVQKLEFITEDLASQVQPSEATLQAFFRDSIDRYRFPERRSFEHVYFNADRRGAAIDADVARVLAELRARPVTLAQAVESGDRFMLPHEYGGLSPDEVARSFGGRFADALFALEVGEWQGPVVSGYGLHIVRVTDVEEGRVPALAEVRDEVLLDYATAARQQASEALYEGLRAQYEIEIDEQAIQSRALRTQAERTTS